MKAIHILMVLLLVGAGVGGGYLLSQATTHSTTPTEVSTPAAQASSPAQDRARAELVEASRALGGGIDAAQWIALRTTRYQEQALDDTNKLVSRNAFVPPAYSRQVSECVVRSLDQSHQNVGGMSSGDVTSEWRSYLSVVDAIESGNGGQFTGNQIRLAGWLRSGVVSRSAQCVQQLVPSGAVQAAYNTWNADRRQRGQVRAQAERAALNQRLEQETQDRVCSEILGNINNPYFSESSRNEFREDYASRGCTGNE